MSSPFATVSVPWPDMFPGGYYWRKLMIDALDIIEVSAWNWASVVEAQRHLTMQTHADCYHGTSLSTAYKICVEGRFKAGASTDAGRTGVFCISAACAADMGDTISLSSGFRHARDRAKCRLCEQWQRFKAPSAYSLPVVVHFLWARNEVSACKKVADSRKWVIQRPVGGSLKPGPFRLLFNVEEFHNWRKVHHLCMDPRNADCLETCKLYSDGRILVPAGLPVVMCGGKIDDPFYFSRPGVNMNSSCGKVCTAHDLILSGWCHARKRPDYDRIWYCPDCWRTARV